MTDRLAALSAAGVAVWLDDLSRDRLVSDGLDRLRREQHVVGVTSNPTIFAKAMHASDEYNWQLHDLAVRQVAVEEALRLVTAYDIRWACDVMRPAYDSSGGLDGRVSLEVDPRLAYRTDQTVAEVRALVWLVDRPNLFIKIPATEAGIPAIADSLAQGISINVTLIFSLERYEQVMEAFLAGMERAREAGRDLSTITSVASFFVSRVDTEVDRRLDRVDTPVARELRGKAGIANARLAYQRYERVFSSPRWQALADAGARPQRPLWASTSVKDPAYPDTMYIDELVAPGVVNTMPEDTITAFADHGDTPTDRVTGSYAAAQRVLDDLAGVGIDYDDVTATLEREGVDKFAASWDELRKSVESELEANR